MIASHQYNSKYNNKYNFTSSLLFTGIAQQFISYVFNLAGTDYLINYVIIFKFHKYMKSTDLDKLTLHDYLQSYNLRKRIQQNKKNKDKQKQPLLVIQQQKNMGSLFSKIDAFMQKSKVDLEDILINTQILRERIYFYLSNILDDLMRKVKDQIGCMYKEVYLHYLIQNEKSANGVNNDTADYFKEKVHETVNQKKRSDIGGVIKERIKIQGKNEQITKLLFTNFIANVDSHENQQNKSVNNHLDSHKNRNQAARRQNGVQQGHNEDYSRTSKIQNLKTPEGSKKKFQTNNFVTALMGLSKQQVGPSKKPKLQNLKETDPNGEIQNDQKTSYKTIQRQKSVQQILKSPIKILLKSKSPG